MKALVSMALSAALISTAATPAEAHDSSGRLVGAWQLRVTTFDCSTGVRNPSFDALFTFNQGGTVNEATANPALQPGQRSPGFGTWDRAGGRYYFVTTEAFILFASAPPAGTPGPRFVRGSQRIEQGVEVRGNRLTSQAKVTFFDQAGTPAGPVLCATAEGERL
jgi:hypothetical protein